MLLCGRSATNAIAIVSYLAQEYARPSRGVSSGEVARARGLPSPLSSKILSALARAGIVLGAPGPGGGYRLSRAPGKICLHDVISAFERVEEGSFCPFDRRFCGRGAPCAIHENLVALRARMLSFLHDTSFEAFAPVPAGDPSPAASGGVASRRGKGRRG